MVEAFGGRGVLRVVPPAQLNAAIKAQDEAKAASAQSVDSATLNSLASYVRTQFDIFKQHRNNATAGWSERLLVALRTFNGQYDAQKLAEIKQLLDNGQMPFRQELEDIHMNIESRLKDIIGAPAGKLHTARSRNDQVATDVALFTREQAAALGASIRELQAALVARAEEHLDAGRPIHALHLVEPVLTRTPDHQRARHVFRAAHRHLLAQSVNFWERAWLTHQMEQYS